MSANADRPGAEEVYNTYFPLVYNYVFYRLLHREDTEDLVSRVFLRVFENLDRFDETKASLKTWVFRITEHALIDFYRRRRVQVSLDDENNQVENTLCVDFDEQYEHIAEPERKALYRALTQLPERDRTFIYYKYFEHRTNRDIAKALGMNESTVAAVLARARAKLKGLLGAEFDA